ncbi:FadR/GntR family transcriptional regulator [Verticiella sediminum]|nr:GntR family transcriptional regulator [Verticiella sediminum]
MNADRNDLATLVSPPTATKAPRLFEEICGQIRARLQEGTLRPGDKLPAERELAVQLGAGRPAVREALRSLEIAGLVELRKGVKGGAFIREGDPAVVTRSIRDMVYLGSISLQALTESRVIVTDAVVRLACERGTEADFQALEDSIAQTEQLERAGDFERRRVQLVAFYGLLSRAARNEVMIMFMDSLTEIVLGILNRVNVPPRPLTLQVQRAVIGELRARNADAAAELMSEHLRALHLYLLEAADAKVGAR